ncbi:hypothetical protein [Flavobacterium sp.]|uniref:hypothetical protein n=1 Tax=Flavobacterium sp. TaxID=239 RepID=UPI0040478187
MQKIILYTILIAFTFLSKVTAQTKKKEQTFEKKLEMISTKMDFLLFKEKTELKHKIDSLESANVQNEMSSEQLKQLKLDFAEKSANRIEIGMEKYKKEMDDLVQSKLDSENKGMSYKIDTINGKRVYVYYKYGEGGHTITLGGSSNDSIGSQTEYNVTSFKIYKGEQDKIERKSKRTTSQFVFAFGLNNVITEGENLNDSDFRVWGSHFYEWGLTYNSRIFKNINLLHAKYGLSVMYNNLRPTDNRYFVKNGDQTDLVTSSVNLDDSRFRNVFLVAPIHLEFDFTPKKMSKDGSKTYFKTHESVRLGIGGYAGVRVKSKQILKYEEDGIKVKDKQKGDFNVSDFTYGLSAYLGYGQTSLYVKYDLNPMFKNNNIDQNNVSLGLRFDFN